MLDRHANYVWSVVTACQTDILTVQGKVVIVRPTEG